LVTREPDWVETASISGFLQLQDERTTFDLPDFLALLAGKDRPGNLRQQRHSRQLTDVETGADPAIGHLFGNRGRDAENDSENHGQCDDQKDLRTCRRYRRKGRVQDCDVALVELTLEANLRCALQACIISPLPVLDFVLEDVELIAITLEM